MKKSRFCRVVFNQHLGLNPEDTRIRMFGGRHTTVLNHKLMEEKTFTYRTDILDLKCGDLVIVPFRDEIVVGVFVKYDPILNKGVNESQIRDLIEVVDLTEYNRKIEIEEQKKELKKAIMQRKEELEEEMLFQMLADKDPVIKEMLEQLTNLDK